MLDKIYGLSNPPTLTRSDDVKMGISTQELLIQKDQLKQVATEFKDDEISVLGNRAITQITKQLDGAIQAQQDKAEKELKEKEALEKDSVKVDGVEGKQEQGKGK